MRKSDSQLGIPYQEYTGTKAAIEALTGLTEGCIAYSTDTDELGTFNGTVWAWGSASSNYTDIFMFMGA